MAYAPKRSESAELATGLTDGKYTKARPNTGSSSMNLHGDEMIHRNKQSLNPLDGYQSIEYPNPVRPD